MPKAALAKDFVQTGVIADPALAELSGMAAMAGDRGLWGVNDSGNPPELLAFGARGKVFRRLPVEGARNLDWEDLAAYQQDGRRELVIADIGDNFALRADVTLYLVPEPGEADVAAKVARSITFRYEDGARDAESLVADVAGGQFLILEKRTHDAGLYSLPMQATDGAVARRIATVDLRHAVSLAQPREAWRLRSLVTSMALSPDAQELALLTYSHLLLFRRGPAGWGAVLNAAPEKILRLPPVSSFESVCFAAASIWMAPEGSSAPLFRHTPGAR